MVEQPSGTVTFVFTDIEGSTRLLAELGDERYREVLAQHRSTVREVFERHDGYEVDNQGDSFFYAFATAVGAITAAEEVVVRLTDSPVRIRVGLHTGEPQLDPPKYVGMDVHRAARIMASASGGQVVISQTTRDLIDGAATLMDLGDHRLKDLSAPIRLYQLGDKDFPPLRSLYRTNLPVPATTFVGRGRELAEVVSLIRTEGVRLVTLTGPGGTGKTRLALQAAAEVADDHPDGLWWVPLAPLRDAALVSLSIEDALQLREERLSTGLAGKRLLLLLDNAEHLLPGIVDVVRELTMQPDAFVLVTSRERLRLQGEHVYAVPSLEDRDSVELFNERARRLDFTFRPDSAVHDLCQRLEGLPLALELAAARTSFYTPEQLLDRLGQRLDLLRGVRDADPRQATLRATIDWSHDLLDPEEQRVYSAFSVFAGGATLEAAEAVCDTDADTLASLLDKSLLRRRVERDRPRYWMLETIREHASEQLARFGDRDAVEARHTACYLALAEEAWHGLTTLGVEPAIWLDRLMDERDNLRAALARSRDTGDRRTLSRLCVALWFMWYFRADSVEGREWLQSALDAEPPDDLRPLVENALASVILQSVDDAGYPAAVELARSALVHARTNRDRVAETMSLITLGNIFTTSDPDAARGHHLEAREIAAEIANAWWQLTATVVLAESAANRREWADASAWLGACRDLLGGQDPGSMLSIDVTTALVEWRLGNLGDARRYLETALAGARRNPRYGAYLELVLAAEVAAHDGQSEAAAVTLSAARARLAELGMQEDDFDLERVAEIEQLVRSSLDDRAWADALLRGTELSVNDAVQLALEVVGNSRP